LNASGLVTISAVSALEPGGARPRIGHLFENLALLRRVALHRLHQIGNEVGAALVLLEHLRPLRLGIFLVGWNIVDPASREENAKTANDDADAGKA
jgi:hypothetical protein